MVSRCATLSAWQDDWSAATWNTAERYTLVRATKRALFHDPLTADQWSGLLAMDPVPVGERVVHEASDHMMSRVGFDYDASWAYFTLYFQGRTRTSRPSIVTLTTTSSFSSLSAGLHETGCSLWLPSASSDCWK